jgi:hypothetical protein
VAWRLRKERWKYWAWTIAAKGMIALICTTIIAEGLRVMMPVLGIRMHRAPFLSFLKDYEATYRLDSATFVALGILLAVWAVWTAVLKKWLGGGTLFPKSDEEKSKEEQKEDRHARFIFVIACGLLCGDALLFYMGSAQMSWGGGFSFSAVLVTAMYVGMSLYIAYVTANMKIEIEKLKEEERCERLSLVR